MTLSERVVLEMPENLARMNYAEGETFVCWEPLWEPQVSPLCRVMELIRDPAYRPELPE